MPKQRSKFRERFEELTVRFVFGIIGAFPLGISMWLGKLLGRSVVRAFPRLSKTANRNLEIAFPGISAAEERRIINGTFESLGRHLGFISHFPKFKHEDIRNLVEMVGGEEHFLPAVESDRGILFFTGHFGSWEVFNLLSPAFGFEEINVVVRRIDNKRVEKYVDSLRTRFGSVTLDKMSETRRMHRVLKDGGILGILADLNVQKIEGMFVDFFGVPASTTTGIAKLALMTNAIIMPAFAVWSEEKKKYVVYLEPWIETDPTKSNTEQIVHITEEITKSVEKWVRKHPEQWLWIHKRWNTRPEGEESLY